MPFVFLPTYTAVPALLSECYPYCFMLSSGQESCLHHFAEQTLKLLLVFQFCGACGPSVPVGVYQLKLARPCDALPFSIIARSTGLQIEVNRRVEAIRGFLPPSHTSLLSLWLYGCPFSFVFSIWVLSGFEPLTPQSPTCILLLVPGIYRRMVTWKLIWNLN